METAVRLEDRDVPEEHRGLHGALYDSESTHEASSSPASGVVENGSVSHEISDWIEKTRDRKVTGVYTVRDEKGTVSFVGVSRDVASSLRSHSKRVPEKARTVRIVEKRSMVRREELESMRAKVLGALSFVPEGNRRENEEDWADSAAAATKDDDQKLVAYDDSKQKMMLAMAVSSKTTTGGSDDLRAAVESDDWSQVVAAQTADTVVETKMPQEVVSPFATRTVDAEEESVFSKGAVDAVLDKVRPMLIADGGNVHVVSVDPSDKSVVLRLEGACGSCGSATTTMKNGIERTLRQAWPDLGEVSRVEDMTRQLTAEIADGLLDPIRSAMSKLGATATVLNANLLGPGVVELEYQGPETVRYGIELSLLDSPLVNEVRWYLPGDEEGP